MCIKNGTMNVRSKGVEKGCGHGTGNDHMSWSSKDSPGSRLKSTHFYSQECLALDSRIMVTWGRVGWNPVCQFFDTFILKKSTFLPLENAWSFMAAWRSSVWVGKPCKKLHSLEAACWRHWMEKTREQSQRCQRSPCCCNLPSQCTRCMSEEGFEVTLAPSVYRRDP